MTSNYNILNNTRVSTFICKILLISFVASITSCIDLKDDLNKMPLDRYSDEAVWQDQALISAFVLATYRSVPTGFSTGYSFASTHSLGAYVDEAAITGEGFHTEFNAGNVTASNNTSTLDYWGRYFGVIRKCNIFLEKIPGAGIDEALKNGMIGEMKVLRAWSYFRLISFYGGVPLIKNPLTLADDLDLPRNTYDECLAFVITDLDEAAALLPLTYAAAERGRITKGAALAVKSRALLYAASPYYNPANDKTKWQKAADAAKAVIDLGIYSLYTDYRTLFLESAEYNSEIIWSRPYNNRVDFEGPNMEMGLYPPGNGGGGGLNPIHNLVRDYETINGLLPENDPQHNPLNQYLNRDPRLYATVLFDGAAFKGRTIETFVPGGVDSNEAIPGQITVPRPGYYLRKFVDETVVNTPTIDKIGSTPWIFARYAEILLNYAEANYYLGNEVVCREYLNKVRSRPGVLMPAITESGAPLLKRLQNERRIELAFEEHRFFDVRRWKIAPVVLNIDALEMRIQKDPATGIKTYIIKSYQKRAFFDRNYLLPIPQSEMDKLKNPGFTQNPGY